MVFESERNARELEAARRTLRRLGFSYNFGDEWKPPLGPAPEWALPRWRRRLIRLLGGYRK